MRQKLKLYVNRVGIALEVVSMWLEHNNIGLMIALVLALSSPAITVMLSGKSNTVTVKNEKMVCELEVTVKSEGFFHRVVSGKCKE